MAGLPALLGDLPSSADGELAIDPDAWVNLRDDEGHIQGRYHTTLQILILFMRGRRRTIHDLGRHRQGEQSQQRARLIDALLKSC